MSSLPNYAKKSATFLHLNEIAAICKRHEANYEEGIITIVDDSHGVGAFGPTGRGTEEYTNTQADILIATLDKAFGVNGGYIVSNASVIDYLRHRSELSSRTQRGRRDQAPGLRQPYR